MATYKLHHLIEMARAGKKFKATYREYPVWLLSTQFDRGEWVAQSITADWTVEFEPEVVEFECTWYEAGSPGPLLPLGDNPEELVATLRSMVGRKWSIVATEKVEGHT